MTHRSLIAVALGVALAVACSEITRPNRVDPLLQRLLDLGFRADEIVDAGDHFVVEGDIIFSKSSLGSGTLITHVTSTLSTTTPASGDTNPRPRFQWWTYPNGVSGQNVLQMRVAINGLSAGWAQGVRDAMSQWNSISGSAVEFVEGSPADITVSYSSSISPAVAQGSFPTNGKPGPTLLVSTNTTYEGYTASQKLLVIAHEFGHIIGFRHTNWQADLSYLNPACSPESQDNAHRIGNSPTSDNASVMNKCTAGNYWNGFSYWDLESTRVLYTLWPIISSNATTTGNPEIVYWTRNAAAVGYFVSFEMLGMDSDINGNPVLVLYNGDHAYTTDTTWSNPGVTYTGDDSCEYRVRVKVVFAADTVDNVNNELYLPICDPNWRNQ